jgi:hypothetical protein
MGYECFIDYDGNEVFVHRHIMEQKLGRKLQPEEEVHHKDEDKLNNDPNNLELKTKSDHTSHHWNHGSNERKLKMSKVKTDNWQNINTLKLNPEKVIEIRRRLDNKEKQKDLAIEFGVSHYTIKDIRYRKTWKQI